jgi:hypothetical protein
LGCSFGISDRKGVILVDNQEQQADLQEVSIYREGFSNLIPGVFVTALITGYEDQCQLAMVWKSLSGVVLSELRYPNISLRIAKDELDRQWQEYKVQNSRVRM